MTTFVKGVDHIVQSPPRRDPAPHPASQTPSADSYSESFILDDIVRHESKCVPVCVNAVCVSFM